MLGDGVGCFKRKRDEVMLEMDYDSITQLGVFDLSWTNVILLILCCNLRLVGLACLLLLLRITGCISQKRWNRIRVGILGQGV